MTDRTCSDCPSPITKASKTGRCRSCAARATQSDPAFRARLEAGLRKVKASPEHRAKVGEMVRRAHAERAGDPAYDARKREQGLRLRRQYDASPEAQARNRARRDDVGALNSARRLSWCPAERRAEYRQLRKSFGAPEARRMIEADLKRQRERRRRRPMTLDEQLARVAAGAALVARPDTRTGGPDFTLGGIATGQL